jgi:transposase
LLVPTLRPRDVVVIVNLSSHKAAAIRPAIRKPGASLIYVPPYSPDLNPIEQAFSKTENIAAKGERTHTRTAGGVYCQIAKPDHAYRVRELLPESRIVNL